MARRPIPKDPGLTARMAVTYFLIGLLYVVFVGILLAAGVGLITVLVIAVALLFVQYYFSDRIALYSMGGRLVSEQEAPRLHQVVDRLCALADLPKPRVAIAEVDFPNAFATGRNPKVAVVCVTRGLLRRLDEPEVEAVLSHELSHVVHRDVAVMTFAGALGVAAGLLTRMAMWAGIFGGFGGYGGRGRSRNNNIFLAELGIIVVSLLVYAISFLLTRALSRYRELAADRSGAILIGRPSLLASALVKVSGELSRIPTRDLRQAEHFNAFYFSPLQSRQFGVSQLFATHPPLEVRLAQLQKLEAQMGRPL
jgi:heat shock protein HtpX